MNNAELILRVLEKHKGSNKAITARALARKIHLPEREVRRIISGIVTEQKSLIASSVHRPFGFYIIKRPGELRECLGQYKSRMDTLDDRASSLCISGVKRFGKEILRGFKFHGYPEQACR